MSRESIMILISILIMLIGLNGLIFGQRVYFKKRRYGLLVILAGFILMFITATMPIEPANGNSNETTKLQVTQTKQDTQQQEQQQPAQQSTQQPQQQASNEKSRPDPKVDFVGYLESYLPPEAKGNVAATKLSDGRYGVLCDFELKDAPFLKTMAKSYARDFVFAAYNSGLPIEYVAISMWQPTGELGLSVTVGGIPASTQPPDTWTNNMIGPTNFIEWVKRNKNYAQDLPHKLNVTGPFAD